MGRGFSFGATGVVDHQDVIWEDGERRFCRAWRDDETRGRQELMAVLPVAEQPTPGISNRLVHEYGLREHLESEWAVRPVELVRERGRTVLLLEPPGGIPLDQLLGTRLEPRRFLRLAVALSASVGRMHRRGLMHKDLKPSNIIFDPAVEQIWLTGFGIASRLLRERQSPKAPELIAGTFAYMAPEQTGRMNRSVDSRSDLYSLGVVLYQLLTGTLPFTAFEPMEWVHCHIARTPEAPYTRAPGIPAQVSAVIMKLLAKIPEERYQTAAAAERDLRRCLADWETGGVKPFPLGEDDRPDRLVLSERLYGREREIASLVASFEEVVATGTTALVLVAGYSGIGKSSVVNELHKALVPLRGLFASGKFDQYQADVPYATLAQAFRSLVRSLLGKPDVELAKWRLALLAALSPNASLLLDLVPELSLIIGEQPAVDPLPAPAAQRRFQLALRSFIGVFARPEHPLALFLDDLQWLDAATLDLLGDLLTGAEASHLLLIGAYRDNEVTATHPLTKKLTAMAQSGSPVSTLLLPPLERSDLERLLADGLHATLDRVAGLAELVQSKTGGNPFFVNQFLSSLADEGLLAFDHAEGQWSWDRERTLAKGYTDNVVELMVRKLERLPAAAQRALQLLACLGSAADRAALCAVRELSAEEVEAELWEALQQELVLLAEGVYRFAHDRVQEAAYSQIPEPLRPELHLRIGRRLVQHTLAARRKEVVFDLVNQLNRARALIVDAEEREQLAELNLFASQRSKAASAYASALEYSETAVATLPEDCWQRRRELAFSAEYAHAESAFLAGELLAAEERSRSLCERELSAVERAQVSCLRVDVYQYLGRGDAAILAGLDYLRRVDIAWPKTPSADDVRREYDLVWDALGERRIEELIDQPLMNDATHRGTVDVLVALATPAWNLDRELLFLVACRATALSLKHGLCDSSCVAYVNLGALTGPRFGDYQLGYRFSALANRLVEQPGLRRFQTFTYLLLGHLALPWMKHILAARELLTQSYESALRVGDFTCASVSAERLHANRLTAGDLLEDTQQRIEESLQSVEVKAFAPVVPGIIVLLGLVRTLRGLTPNFGTFDDSQTDERQLEQQLGSNPLFAIPHCYYWVRKLQARFFARDISDALAAEKRSKALLALLPPGVELADYHYYAALALAASCDPARPAPRDVLEVLAAHQEKLAAWASACPENFGNRAALVAAEAARVEGRDLQAMRLYDQAIRSAQTHGFVHYEALSAELAGRFYEQQGFEEIARLYLRSARHGYVRWGAQGKVWQLEAEYPHLGELLPPAQGSTVATPIDRLDLATVLKVSQAISSEIALDKLIDALMRAALEHAGAERGLLILARGQGYRIEAEATTNRDTVQVTMHQAEVSPDALPESVFHYVVRTRELVILHHAAEAGEFSADEYVRAHRSRSVLCLPLVKQTKLLGVLYLENNLSTDVFTMTRLSVLKLLASEAAISLENSNLYLHLQEREARARRLVDSNIIGIFIATMDDDQIMDANDEFLRIIGYDRDDLTAGLVRLSALTPDDWHEADTVASAQVAAAGTHEPYEKEYQKKDGSRVPVLLGSALFEDRNEGVAFVLDLSERKRAEEAARQSERRYHDVQAELAHASRVATLGQLSASIAHEVNQPLTGIVTNTSTCLRLLEAEPLNLDGARETARRSKRDALRASEIIQRLRALFSKAETKIEQLDLNEAVREVIALFKAELRTRQISLRSELAENLPKVPGDRIQIQQVVLNLIKNAMDSMSASADGVRQLLVQTVPTELGVLVAVEDSGPGIAPEDLERVFDAFYTTKPDGLGVGLSICSAIAKAHHGELSVASVHSRGARFLFSLPAKTPASES